MIELPMGEDEVELVDYQKSWNKRFEQIEEEKKSLLRNLRESAFTAARILVDQFHAQKVSLFGSLQNPDFFHEDSDVDLVVEGLPPQNYFSALAKVADLFGGRRVDLLPLEDVPKNLEKQIKEKGEFLYGKI